MSKNLYKKTLSILLRLLALGLCLHSTQKAWAGFWLYQGEKAFEGGQDQKAIYFFEKAGPWDRENPRLIYLTGQSYWREGSENKNAEWLKRSLEYFEKLTARLPGYGRGWLYRGLAELAMERDSGDGMTAAEWQRIKNFLQRAFELEPGSPWMAYMTGTHLVSDTRFLSDQEKKTALERIKKSLTLHHPGQASPYLKPALSFLWERFSDFELLREMTPREAPSYDALIEFIDQSGLWAYRERVYPDFLRLDEAAYQSQCEKAEKFLRKNLFRQAFSEFQKAFWRNKIFVRARAGMLVSQEAMDELPADFQASLKQILEEEEEAIGSLIDFLQPLVMRSGDAYLKGLYAFRKNNFLAARTELERTTPDEARRLRRRYLAASLWQLGERQKAFETLKPALDEENPDLRELYLFKKWDSPYRRAVLRKIRSIATRSRSPEEWWGWGGGEKGFRHRLDRRARMGVMVNLKPGEVRLRLTLRSIPGSNGYYGYLLVRLADQDQERRIGTAYLNHQDWREVDFQLRTLGGNRWLEAELLNGSETPETHGPLVDFGGLEIEYLS